MRSSDSHASSFTCMTQGPDLAAQHAAVIACSGAGVPVCDLYKNVETHDNQPHVTMLFSGWYLSTEKMLIQDIDEAAAARWRPTRPMHAVTSSCPREAEARCRVAGVTYCSNVRRLQPLVDARDYHPHAHKDFDLFPRPHVRRCDAAKRCLSMATGS